MEQTDIVIENENAEAEAEGIEGTSTETTLNVAVEAAGGTGEEHSEQHSERGVRSHRGRRASCTMRTFGRRGWFCRVTCQQRHERGKKDGEEVGETAAAKETEEVSNEDVEIRRLVEERRSRPKAEKQRLKEVSKCFKKVSETKKKENLQDIQRIFEDFKDVKNIPGIKSAKKRVLITKTKNEKGVSKRDCQFL